ncbi:MAG: Methyltransferase type 11 [Solirubrobacterales bacterium]|nr:Methyltransferase type 11 [Solirubrobacterales bacterium]
MLRDYSRQAKTYDETRSASPSVLAVLREALGGAPGRRLADIGGGTGNYARALAAEGWEPVVVDRSSEMLARAVAKGLRTVEADAQRLPFADGSFDAAMLVSMLHHVEDVPAALSEARRILRPAGRLAAMVFTREDLEPLWYADYFPSTTAWMERSHPRLAELLRHLPGGRCLPVVLRDMEDASLAALAARPELVLEERWRRQTSFFERLARDHPDELRAGLDRLATDLAADRRPSGRGRATVLAWIKGST